MSNVLSLGLLTQRREDAKMMEARAKELLKELNPNSRVELKIDFNEAVAFAFPSTIMILRKKSPEFFKEKVS